MENYEEKYKEALETARKINSGEGVAAPKGWNALEVIFPELKESEDERIRKELLDYLDERRVIEMPTDTTVKEEWIAWLEKQGEQKPQEKSAFEAAKEEKVDDANKKFKVGDWIISNDNSRLFRRIIEVNKFGYTTDCGYCSHYENYFHLWTIQDAEKGDVLEFADHGRIVIGIVSHVNKVTGKVDVNCLLEGNNFKLGNYYALDTIKPHPATKEQHDLLFQKMKEMGYEWDSEKKELKRIEQNPAYNWNELTWKDIVTLEGIINNVHYEFRNGIGQESFGKEVLEKFRETKGDEYMDSCEQNPAWSEEDEEMIDAVIVDIQFAQKAYNHEVNQIVYEREIDWLKSLKQRLNGTE